MQHVLNIISAKIIIGAPCNVIPGLWELYANTLQPGERGGVGGGAAGLGRRRKESKRKEEKKKKRQEI